MKKVLSYSLVLGSLVYLCLIFLPSSLDGSFELETHLGDPELVDSLTASMQVNTASMRESLSKLDDLDIYDIPVTFSQQNFHSHMNGFLLDAQIETLLKDQLTQKNLRIIADDHLLVSDNILLGMDFGAMYRSTKPDIDIHVYDYQRDQLEIFKFPVYEYFDDIYQLQLGHLVRITPDSLQFTLVNWTDSGQLATHLVTLFEGDRVDYQPLDALTGLYPGSQLIQASSDYSSQLVLFDEEADKLLIYDFEQEELLPLDVSKESLNSVKSLAEVTFSERDQIYTLKPHSSSGLILEKYNWKKKGFEGNDQLDLDSDLRILDRSLIVQDAQLVLASIYHENPKEVDLRVFDLDDGQLIYHGSMKAKNDFEFSSIAWSNPNHLSYW